MGTFVNSQISRTNRNFLLTNALLLAIFAVIALSSVRYLSNLVQGPRPIGTAELLSITDPSTVDRYYVTVSGDAIANTGIAQVTTKSRRGVTTETNDAGFYLLKVGDKILLLEQKDIEDSSGITTFSGTLEAIPDDEQREIIQYMGLKQPELKSRFLPFKLDARPYATAAHYFLIAAVAAMGLISTFNVIRAVLRMTNPATHPLRIRLARFGNPISVMAELDAQFPAHSKDKLLVSDRWLAKLSLFGADVSRLEDIAWVYLARKQKKAGNVVTRETAELIYHDRSGQKTAVDFGKDLSRASQLLTNLSVRAPWAMHGYSAEVERKWDKNRADFINWVDQRRATS